MQSRTIFVGSSEFRTRLEGNSPILRVIFSTERAMILPKVTLDLGLDCVSLSSDAGKVKSQVVSSTVRL